MLSMEERLAQLERRVLSLEGRVYHAGALARAVRQVVERWPGPFTAHQIRDTVYDLQPGLRPVTEHDQVALLLCRMEKAGQVVCTERGAGPNPNIYVRAECPPSEGGKRGAKFGHRRDYESGFRGIVRVAMDELPEEWTILDLRDWVAKRLPETQVPYGSWSSTLYKLTQQEELVVVRGGRKNGAGLKVYKRGPRRIGVTGQELTELESAWKEFRAQIETEPLPDFETPLERGVA